MASRVASSAFPRARGPAPAPPRRRLRGNQLRGPFGTRRAPTAWPSVWRRCSERSCSTSGALGFRATAASSMAGRIDLDGPRPLPGEAARSQRPRRARPGRSTRHRRSAAATSRSQSAMARSTWRSASARPETATASLAAAIDAASASAGLPAAVQWWASSAASGRPPASVASSVRARAILVEPSRSPGSSVA